MSIKPALQGKHNDFDTIDSLKAGKLTIEELPETTTRLEEATVSGDLETVLSKAVQESIHEIVKKTMNSLEIKGFKTYSIEELGEKIQNFVKTENAGSFEFYDRAGRNVFKCKHNLGNIGSQFFMDLITSSLKANFTNIAYHLTESNDSVSVVFRQN